MPNETSPEADVQTSELGRLLERQIDQLPEGLRAVLVLRDVIELDTAERIWTDPQDDYTRTLLASFPRLTGERGVVHR